MNGLKNIWLRGALSAPTRAEGTRRAWAGSGRRETALLREAVGAHPGRRGAGLCQHLLGQTDVWKGPLQGPNLR